jgi:hypothetical protein
MDKEIEPVLTHDHKTLWEYLTRYATYQPPAGWQVEMNAGCYYGLMWGSKIATQFRIPTSPNSKQWANTRLCHISVKDRPEFINTGNQFLSFLIDRKLSPWRSVNHAFEVIRDDTGHATGLYCKDASQITRAMTHNFCIAVRKSWEQGHVVARWRQLVDMGLDPVAALYYATFTSLSTDKKDVHFNAHQSHAWVTFMNSATTVPSLAALDNPPVDKVDQTPFSAKTRSLPQSNFIWLFKGNPRTLALGKEFPEKLVGKKNIPYTQLQTPKMETEAFNEHVIKAAAKRRQMEQAYLKKEKK